MNKEFLKEMYDVVSAEGYPDDYPTFVSEIQSNPEFRRELFTTVKEQGYPDTFNDFTALIGVKRTPSEIKSQGDAEYKLMMDKIKSTQDSIDKPQKDRLMSFYPTSPLANAAFSLIAPSSAQSLREGEFPQWEDALVDIPLAATTFIPPLRAASTGGAIAKNAALNSGIAMAGDVAQNYVHDDDPNVASGLASGLVGGLVGGFVGKNSQAKNLITDQFPGIKLAMTNKGTISNMRKGIPQQISDIPLQYPGYAYVDSPVNPEIVLDASKELQSAIKQKIKDNAITASEIKDKEKLIKNISDNFYKIGKYTDGKIPLKNALTETEIVFNKDPEVGGMLYNSLKPALREQIDASNSNIISSILDELTPDQVKDPEVMQLVNTVSQRADAYAQPILANNILDKKFNKINEANKYEQLTKPKIEKPMDEIKPLKIVKDIVSTKNSSPEKLATISKSQQLIAPRITNVADPYTTKSKSNEVDNSFAHMGRVSWDWLWKEADKIKKRK